MPFFPLVKSVNKLKSDNGVSLIELLLVIVIIATCVILLANLPNALGLVTKSKHVSLAREIAAKQIEDKRSISYANLVNDSSSINDARMSSLPSGAGSVTVSDCDSSVCSLAEHIKKVTVTINWRDGSKDQTINLTTLIGEGGINQ